MRTIMQAMLIFGGVLATLAVSVLTLVGIASPLVPGVAVAILGLAALCFIWPTVYVLFLVIARLGHAEAATGPTARHGVT